MMVAINIFSQMLLKKKSFTVITL